MTNYPNNSTFIRPARAVKFFLTIPNRAVVETTFQILDNRQTRPDIVFMTLSQKRSRMYLENIVVAVFLHRFWDNIKKTVVNAAQVYVFVWWTYGLCRKYDFLPFKSKTTLVYYGSAGLLLQDRLHRCLQSVTNILHRLWWYVFSTNVGQ